MSPKKFIQESHEIGWRKAWAHFYQRRHLPVVAYLILAGFTGYAFTLEREHSNQNRRELTAQQRVILIRGCERQNDLRSALTKLLRQNYSTIHKYVAEGTLTPTQGHRAINQTRIALRLIAPVNCFSIYSLPKK